MYRFHRYNLIRWDISSPSVAYKLFVRGLYDYVIVKEETSSGVTTRGYFVAAKGLETSWNNRASLTYSSDIKGRKLVNEGQSWIIANGGGESYSYLLDDYSGASAAYSLRKLNSSYSGDAIVVRRSSDNATQSIGFNNNELDISSLTTFCSGTDGFVTTWYDQSGNGYDVTQTTASSQPQIFDSVTGVILDNGKPAMDFESQKFFTTTSIIDYETAFTVANIETVPIYSYLLQDSINNKGIGYTALSLGLFFYNGVSVRPLPNQDTNQLLGFFDNNGVNLKMAKNGESETTFSENIKFSFNNISRPIKNLDFKGLIQEIVTYSDSQLTNRTAIEDNINNYYSIY